MSELIRSLDEAIVILLLSLCHSVCVYDLLVLMRDVAIDVNGIMIRRTKKKNLLI